MDENKIQLIIERLAKLPPEIQAAYSWLIENIDVADRIAEKSNLTKEEIQTYIKWSLERKDYAMLMLVLYKEAREKGRYKHKTDENICN